MLLLQALQSDEAVFWLRSLQILQSRGYAEFLRIHGHLFLPKVIFCARAEEVQFENSSGSDDEGGEY